MPEVYTSKNRIADYPFPWSLENNDATLIPMRSQESCERLGAQVMKPLHKWLETFRDKQAGCSSPPPMS